MAPLRNSSNILNDTKLVLPLENLDTHFCSEPKLYENISLKTLMVFIFFEIETEKKSCGHGLCIEAQDGSHYCHCAQNSSPDESGVCVKSKKPSKILIKI